MDAAKSGAKIGVACLIAQCSALLRKSVRGGLVVVGEVTLGGSIAPIHNAVSLAEIAVEKGAKSFIHLAVVQHISNTFNATLHQPQLHHMAANDAAEKHCVQKSATHRCASASPWVFRRAG